MKGKLIKLELSESYRLDDEKGNIVASTLDGAKTKLSKQNCDEIFGVVDVEKLAEESVTEVSETNPDFFLKDVYKEFFKDGFNKRDELNKDKVFTLEKFIDLYVEETGYGMDMWSEEENKVMTTIAKIIQSIQKPTEIDVEIVMRNSRTGNIVKHDSDLEWDEDGLCDRAIPKLDSNGCLILKKI